MPQGMPEVDFDVAEADTSSLEFGLVCFLWGYICANSNQDSTPVGVEFPSVAPPGALESEGNHKECLGIRSRISFSLGPNSLASQSLEPGSRQDLVDAGSAF